jgi:hypothetical protein
MPAPYVPFVRVASLPAATTGRIPAARASANAWAYRFTRPSTVGQVVVQRALSPSPPRLRLIARTLYVRARAIARAIAFTTTVSSARFAYSPVSVKR